MTSWYDEVEHWNFGSSRSNGGVTGHFTQIVWRSSVEVGCAVNSNCNNMFGGMGNSAVVCRYAPAGNMMGRESQEVGRLTSSGCGRTDLSTSEGQVVKATLGGTLLPDPQPWPKDGGAK